MGKLLGVGLYQEIRPAVANCSPEGPDFLAIESCKGSISIEPFQF